LKSLLCGFTLLALALASGCGNADSSLPNLVKVTGTVKCNGKPLESGTVSFNPIDPKVGQPVTGVVKDGSFDLVTSVSSPGVVIGKYQVSVASVDSSAVPSDPSKPKPVAAASPVPKKYGSPKTSGLEVDVKAGMAPLDWDLKD
jgi:hypothetical protein